MTQHRAWGLVALDLFLPTPCAACGGLRTSTPNTPGTWTLCGACQQSLPTTLACLVPTPGLFRAGFWWDEYDSPTGAALRRGKYRPDHSTLRALSQALGSAARGRLPAVDWVVPVPQTPQAWLKRGFSPAYVLASGVGDSLGCPVRMALGRGWGQAQAGRSASERRQNVQGAFSARVTLQGQRVLLVDDTVTSGATASACAQELLNAGAAHVVLLAATRAA
ncbi:MAG: putative amidophosphoribosyltransferase [Cognaticolwellia sp.]|jgi:predicted amidophosphoribosyltransferase